MNKFRLNRIVNKANKKLIELGKEPIHLNLESKFGRIMVYYDGIAIIPLFYKDKKVSVKGLVDFVLNKRIPVEVEGKLYQIRRDNGHKWNKTIRKQGEKLLAQIDDKDKELVWEMFEQWSGANLDKKGNYEVN